jgi:phosphate transport system protein
METADLSHHISSRFNEDLERLRSSLLAMGGLVEQQLGKSLAVLLEADSEAGEAVVAGDAEVNRMEKQIDEECLRVLATRSPAAGDLRLIISIVKTITDLERIGDESRRVARFGAHLATMERPADRYREIRHLGRLVQSLVHDALDAFARMDVDAALATARRDRLVDEEYEAIQRQFVTFMMEDPRQIRRALDVMWVVRALERVGDHAKNVSEYVVYLVHGQDVRHTRLEEVEHRIRARDAGSGARPEADPH